MALGDALGGGVGDAFLFEFDGFGDLFPVAILDAVDCDGEFVFPLFCEEVAPALGDGFEEIETSEAAIKAYTGRLLGG